MENLNYEFTYYLHLLQENLVLITDLTQQGTKIA